jgi:hypothetical protein
VVGAVAALGMILAYRYLAARKRAQMELTGGEQYRRLAEEYRRLADIAITAQEHTDFKLGDLSAQLDYLRGRNDSLQKILKDVEWLDFRGSTPRFSQASQMMMFVLRVASGFEPEHGGDGGSKTSELSAWASGFMARMSCRALRIQAGSAGGAGCSSRCWPLEQRDLFPAQALDPAVAAAGGQAGLAGRDPCPPGGEKLADLCSVTAPQPGRYRRYL